MPKGGHAHSGPPRDPNSGRSERRGLTGTTTLPSEGYSGEFPRLLDYLPDATERHEAIWSELWSTPQASMWARERWRWPVVADLVKWMVRSGDPDAPAAVATAVRQLRDDLALSTAGLRQHGWTVAPDQVSEKRAERSEEAPRRERRLRPAVGDDQQ